MRGATSCLRGSSNHRSSWVSGGWLLPGLFITSRSQNEHLSEGITDAAARRVRPLLAAVAQAEGDSTARPTRSSLTCASASICRVG